MRSTRFVAVGERLLDAGIAPRHARRAVIELADHFDDLVSELESRGHSRDDAEAQASARLNPDALVTAAVARAELHSWVHRWPLVACTVFPLGMYMAYVVGSIALIVGGVTIFDHSFGVELASSPALQRFAATWMSDIAWAVPIFAAGTFCSVAQSRRMPLGRTLIGAVLVSLVGAMLNAGLVLWPNDHPQFQAGIGIGTDALAEPLKRAALTLAIVLPFYFWQRAIILGRVRKPSPSQVIASVAVIVLHIAVLFLLSARTPRIGSNTNESSMTLVVIPPVTQASAVAPAPLTPATVRSRDIVIVPPTLPAEGVPPDTERTPIDFAREGALAVQREVAAIELERRRTLGFTPEAQNREPDVIRAPAPEFGWSSTAQRVEVLPEGGILIRLSERCVVAVTLVMVPACAIGDIPANGELFEHMTDQPVVGDWKDDSTLRR